MGFIMTFSYTYTYMMHFGHTDNKLTSCHGAYLQDTLKRQK